MGSWSLFLDTAFTNKPPSQILSDYSSAAARSYPALYPHCINSDEQRGALGVSLGRRHEHRLPRGSLHVPVTCRAPRALSPRFPRAAYGSLSASPDYTFSLVHIQIFIVTAISKLQNMFRENTAINSSSLFSLGKDRDCGNCKSYCSSV